MILEIKDLHAGYGELKILNGINIEVKPKNIVALIGPNGAGKSTVLKSVFNISNITKGKILFLGKNIIGLPTYELLKCGISFVPQGKINFPNLTVRENLQLGSMNEELLNEVFETFPALKQKQHQRCGGLSGGQQQMVALGRALMQKPKLILMDEPTLGLSPILQKQLFNELVKLRDKTKISILIVEQNAKQAIAVANHTYLLETGKIALSGGQEISKDPKIQKIYLGGHY